MPIYSLAKKFKKRSAAENKNQASVQVYEGVNRDSETFPLSDLPRRDEIPSPTYDSTHPSYNSKPHLWTPTALRPVTLIVFAVLFAIGIIVVEVLYSVSNRNHGLSASDPKYRYLWTYGPTAVLIIVAGCWGQVEYRTKQLIPWQSMHQTPRPASQSLLLDYVSDWNVVAFFRSLKRLHWAVALAILGTLLLKLVTVFSTGLFMLQNVHLTNVSTDLTAQAAFSGKGYTSASVDGNAALNVVGHSLFNLSHPLGTTDKYAFAPFQRSSDSSDINTIVSSTVDLFSADLSCEAAKVTNWTQDCRSRGCENYRLNMTLSTSSCSAYRFTAFYQTPYGAGGYYGDIFSEECADENSDVTGPQLMLVAARWGNNQTKIQSLVCQPTYTISSGLVSLINSNQSVSSIRPHNDTKKGTLADVSPVDVSAGVMSTLSVTQDAISSLVSSGVYNISDPNSNYLSPFYLIATDSGDDREALFDTDYLKDVSRSTYAAIAAQVARQYLMTDDIHTIKGTYSAGTKRLVVRELSVRLMESLLAVLIVTVGAIWFWRPVHSTPRDPGTISGMATILARSPNLSNTLTGVKNKKDLKASLVGSKFHSETVHQDGQWTFGIVSDPTTSAGAREDQASNKIEWWRPLPMSLWWRIFALVVPLLVIIGLETAYQISHQRNGLADIHSDGYIHYTWVYIPAVIMLLIQSLFDGIHFSTELLEPYVQLRRGGVAARESIMDNHLSELTAYAFWNSLVKRKYSICATAMTMLLAPCLTIAASGLYSTEDVSHKLPVSIVRSDSFNSTIDAKSYNQHEKGLGLAGALIVTANLSYPAWTYDELVLPTLDVSSLTDVKHNTAYQPENATEEQIVYRLTLPALRAGLTCETITANNVKEMKVTSGSDSTYMTIDVHLSDDCWNSADSLKNGTVTNKVYDVTFKVNATEVADMPFGSFKNTAATMNQTYCPIMVGLYGQVAKTNTTDGIKGFKCRPYVEQVQADTRFGLPGFQVLSAAAQDSSRELISDDFAAQLDLDQFLPDSVVTPDEAFDAFFSAMIRDQKTLTVADVTQGDSQAKVINATQHLYRVLMAQSLNGNSRLSQKNSTYNGTLLDPNRTRLQQSAVSTRILEGFLAAMVLCSLVALYFTRTREVIPLNPCSIAGASTLLAGSEMLKPDVIPPGSEWCSDQELVRRRVYSGLVFGLGWWEGKRFAVDIGRPEEEAAVR
ncbi:hypothetical protein BDV25DRAFT_146520 [Aspergillus avenaceus]|uniref:Uncharacterized protein n=1 Tax=Aspergillus avenaceus TaxID=36643 RepID=A0A5N6U9R1_ASPAV|nr:hypothetical protein BDV25DRAFT_146520 [Aspergillus avenaceus]